ncbi:MAG: coproporphyrinogen-III oxidase family protein [Bryobacterales bacterium]
MLGVYLSFPFCRQKCTYCNFASGVFADALRQKYAPALAREIAAADLSSADTLYLGGGTPSLMSANEWAIVGQALGRREWSEATLETSPGDITPERAALWRHWGIDRVSLGVQSFDPRVAAAAGRKHTPEMVRDEIGVLGKAGITRVNVDLIAGLAHQTEANWLDSLDWAERLGVEHVSVYMLEVDDESRLGEELRSGGQRYGAKNVPDEDQITGFYLQAVERLAAMGIERYEISNFARPGAESRHNLKYWSWQPYYGFGADAHSFDGSRRWANVRTAADYVATDAPRLDEEQLDEERKLQDFLLTGLRRSQGVALSPQQLSALDGAAAGLIERGWLEQPAPDRLRLTPDGILFSNEVFYELLFQ